MTFVTHTLALSAGVIIGLIIHATFSTEDNVWKSDAIQNGCAYYHSQTGEFTWKESK